MRGPSVQQYCIQFHIQGPLIFNPNKKEEVWRYLTYMFVHSGYFHITFNVLIQVSCGVSAHSRLLTCS